MQKIEEINKNPKKPSKLFGIWKDRKEIKNINNYVKEKRSKKRINIDKK